VERRIRELQPDAIFLNGISYLLFFRALITARRMGVPAWLRSETQDHAFSRSRIKGFVRRWIYRIAYAQFAHFFPIGKLNAAHYRAHGVRDQQMTFCHYCVVDRFEASTDELRSRRVMKRQALGIAANRTVVMFSGKLIPKKYPAVLLEAWERLPSEFRSRFILLFVGSGEQQTELAEKAAQSGAHVVFAGFVNQSAIADYYLASDAVILPSRQMGETWGLVANEALLAGKPIILSKNAGSSVDFKDFPGVQVIDPTPEAVAKAFLHIKEMPSGDTVRQAMSDYTIEAAVDAIVGKILEASRLRNP
jgi:glycosyltransferase involved in cell wall biosynthesis